MQDNEWKFWKILMVSTTLTIFNAIIKKLMLFLLIYLHSDFFNALQLGLLRALSKVLVFSQAPALVQYYKPYYKWSHNPPTILKNC